MLFPIALVKNNNKQKSINPLHKPPFWGGKWGIKQKSIMSTGKVLLGTVAGLAIGAIAGILYAPEKGSTTRKQIMDKSDDYLDEVKSKYDEFRDSVAEKFKSAKDDAEELADKGKEKYNDAKNEVKNAAAIIKHNGAADFNHATS